MLVLSKEEMNRLADAIKVFDDVNYWYKCIKSGMLCAKEITEDDKARSKIDDAVSNLTLVGNYISLCRCFTISSLHDGRFSIRLENQNITDDELLRTRLIDIITRSLTKIGFYMGRVPENDSFNPEGHLEELSRSAIFITEIIINAKSESN